MHTESPAIQFLKSWYHKFDGEQIFMDIVEDLLVDYTSYANYLQLSNLGFAHLANLSKNSLCLTSHKIPVTRQIIADIDQFPIMDNEYEMILLPHILEYSSANIENIVNECYRVLKPNGRLVMIGFNLSALKRLTLSLIRDDRTDYSQQYCIYSSTTLKKIMLPYDFKFLDTNCYFRKQTGILARMANIHKASLLSRRIAEQYGDVIVTMYQKQVTGDTLVNKKYLLADEIPALRNEVWD